ncbi:Uncharacterized protein FKW44_007279, partial [Caligus rogercresseyi]
KMPPYFLSRERKCTPRLLQGLRWDGVAWARTTYPDDNYTQDDLEFMPCRHVRLLTGLKHVAQLMPRPEPVDFSK